MEMKEYHHGEQYVSDPITATHQYLLTNFGPLLTLKHLAEVLHSTPSGLRMAMYRKRDPFSCELAGTHRRVGRRIFFEARKVAKIIDQDKGGAEAGNIDLSRVRGMPHQDK